MLCDELSRQGFSVRSYRDEQALLASAKVLHHDEFVILGPSVSMASEASLFERLGAASHWVTMVNLPDLRRMLAGRGWTDDEEYMADTVLDMEELVRNLKRMMEAMGFQAGRLAGNQARDDLVLQRDGTAWWKGMKVPLTIGEFAIVQLLAGNFRRFVSYDTIYALRHAELGEAGADPHQRRICVRSAVKRIRKKFRNSDPDFAEIQSYSAFGYRWGGAPRENTSA